MGLFKALKDAKALGDYHGGRPPLRESFNSISAIADDRGENEILKHGTPTKAVVQGVATPIPGDRFALQVPLDVYPPDGGPSYRLDHQFPIGRMKAALSVGMEIPVKVDQTDATRIAVQWDAQNASIAAAGGDFAAVQRGLENTYSGTADAASRSAMAGGATVGTAAAPSANPLDKIAQLATLRDSGAITEEEFAAKKAELLSKM